MNGIAVIIFIIYVIALLSLRFIKVENIRYRYLIRKSVHLGTGVVIFGLTFILNRNAVLLLIATGTFFSLITYNLKKFNFIHTTSGSSLGTLFYPVGLLISFVILYNMPICYFQITLLVLSISDTLANLCGRIKKRNMRFIVFHERKSVFGVLGFALSACIIHVLLLPEPHANVYSYILLSVLAAVNFEVISYRGSDNLSIPVGCSLFFFFTKGACLNSSLLFTVILVIACGSIMLYKKEILTRYGSIAAYFLGIYFFDVLGIAWSIPVVTFFVTSVIFTKVNSFANDKKENSDIRNIWQVCANIIFATASSAGYTITGNQIFIYIYITLIATVTADTWASELGPVLSSKCFSLSDSQFHDPGISGGISVQGTIAALVGSASIAILSNYLFFHNFNIVIISMITAAGFAAVFVDSLLGAFLEPRLLTMPFFKRRYGSDSPSPNDIINLSASLTAPVFFIIFRTMV